MVRQFEIEPTSKNYGIGSKGPLIRFRYSDGPSNSRLFLKFFECFPAVPSDLLNEFKNMVLFINGIEIFMTFTLIR